MEKVNFKDITIILDTKGTRQGFKHEGLVFYKNYMEFKTACNYLNRTWEVFTYQSLLNKICNIIIENEENNAIIKYKENNNIKRLTEKQKKEIIKDHDSKLLKQARQLKKLVNDAISLGGLQLATDKKR